MEAKKKKVLLIGWDAADWKTINPLMDAGEMPTLEKLVNKGVMGKLSTLDPPLSPTLWTSISTGKRPYKHGIQNFVEPAPDNSGVRPVHITSRKVRAIWNILSNKGYKCHQVGWWPSHPAEPINGISISNFYQRANQPITEPWPMLEGTVHPKEKEELFAALRLHPQELTGEHIQPFVPDAHLLNQNDKAVQNRLSSIAKITADCTSIHSAATYILENEEWDFMAVYYDAIDHYSHGFMKYHPPRRPHINEEDYNYFNGVVKAGYKFHDMMLEKLINSVPEDTTIMLISDHGFHSDHLRPVVIPKEPAGPAYEHSPYGIIVAAGPEIKEDEVINGASLLDITPSILHLLGLPVGVDMDGKVLVNMFKKFNQVQTIKSYEDLEGDFFTHPDNFEEDPSVTAEAMKQLVDLGYIAPPSPNEEENINRTIEETNYYTARAYIDAGIYSKAIPILEKLAGDHPAKTHYFQRLGNCYLQLKKTGKARKTVQKLRSIVGQNTIVLLVMQARVLLQEEAYDEALEYIEEAIAMRNESPGLHLYKGKVLLFQKNFEKAKESLEIALKQDAENENVHHNLGLLKSRTDRHKEAVDHFFTSIGLRFYNAETHYQLGNSLEKIEENDAAANAYMNCIHFSPKHLKARRALHHLYAEVLNLPQRAAAIQATLPDYTRPNITVVSGLPRSGTSMMMQMLEAAGIAAFTDDLRTADENNRKGYYEHDRIKYLQRDPEILRNVGDKVVKIVAPLLFHLPVNYRYKIIFMERELGEVLLSQHKMLKRDKKRKSDEVFSFNLWKKFEEIIVNIKKTYKDTPNFSFLYINHRDIIEDPLAAATEVRDFLEIEDMDIHAMAAAVDPSLYRERESIK